MSLFNVATRLSKTRFAPKVINNSCGFLFVFFEKFGKRKREVKWVGHLRFLIITFVLKTP